VLAAVVHGDPPSPNKEMDEFALYPSDKLKWQEGPPSLPKGARIAVLEGNPAKEGPFVFRLKIPDGYRVPPHVHPKTERITVLSGTFHVGMGDKFDAKAGKAMPAGTYGHWPAGMKHFVWAKGETVLQFHGMGPWSIQYVNPDDDPRNQTKAVPEKTKSGPEVGDQLPGPVYALVCVDAQRDLVGKKSELVLERYGPKQGVLVFARDFNEQVARLIRRLDDELAKNKAAKAKGKEGHALVVLLSDDDALESQLKDFGAKHNVNQVTTGIDPSAGSPKWMLSREADVTIILYERFKVTRNYALKRGELKGETIETIVADVSTFFGR
jgi:quercetin dioxygenase-like cupin family protein